MYPLPAKYNTDLISKYGYYSKTIQREDGIGILLNISEFVFDTNQFALEQYFYHRLKRGGYLTNNSAEADLFYIPFFGNLAKVAGQYPLYGDFWDYMSKKYNLTHKNPAIILPKHFTIYGGVRKYAQPFMDHWYIGMMNAVVLERNEPRKNRSNLIVAPYPGQVHFYQDRHDKIDYSAKTLLVSSAWNSRYSLRWTLSDMCNKRKNICTHIELWSNNDNYNHTYLYEVTAKSVFCLSPHGDSSTRKAFWDALLVGCINVVYTDEVKMPFDDIINYSNLTVYIPKERVTDTFNILQNMTKEEIKQKQLYIEKNRIHFQYTIIEKKDNSQDFPFHKKDAFNLLIDQLYQQSVARVNNTKNKN